MQTPTPAQRRALIAALDNGGLLPDSTPTRIRNTLAAKEWATDPAAGRPRITDAGRRALGGAPLGPGALDVPALPESGADPITAVRRLTEETGEPPTRHALFRAGVDIVAALPAAVATGRLVEHDQGSHLSPSYTLPG